MRIGKITYPIKYSSNLVKTNSYTNKTNLNIRRTFFKSQYTRRLNKKNKYTRHLSSNPFIINFTIIQYDIPIRSRRLTWNKPTWGEKKIGIIGVPIQLGTFIRIQTPKFHKNKTSYQQCI